VDRAVVTTVDPATLRPDEERDDSGHIIGAAEAESRRNLLREQCLYLLT
jgi:hypothetical protein